MPVSKNGLALTNEELRISVCLRLGLPIFASHDCVCGERVDVHGYHNFACKRNGGKHVRHNAMNQLFLREIERCDTPCQLEPNGLLHSSNLRPDGVTLTPWCKGKQLMWDFTCTHIHSRCLKLTRNSRCFGTVSYTHLTLPTKA